MNKNCIEYRRDYTAQLCGDSNYITIQRFSIEQPTVISWKVTTGVCLWHNWMSNSRNCRRFFFSFLGLPGLHFYQTDVPGVEREMDMISRFIEYTSWCEIVIERSKSAGAWHLNWGFISDSSSKKQVFVFFLNANSSMVFDSTLVDGKNITLPGTAGVTISY